MIGIPARQRAAPADRISRLTRSEEVGRPVRATGTVRVVGRSCMASKPDHDTDNLIFGEATPHVGRSWAHGDKAWSVQARPYWIGARPRPA